MDILQPLRNIECKIKQKINLENSESKKFSRKRLENTMKMQSIKENSMKLFQPSSNIGRNQTFSSVKYCNSFSSSQSTERITPIQSFISRRV